MEKKQYIKPEAEIALIEQTTSMLITSELPFINDDPLDEDEEYDQ